MKSAVMRFIIFIMLFLPSCVEALELSERGIDAIIQEMPLNDKVGQLFFSFFHGQELTDESRDFIRSCRLGNIIYFNWSNGLNSPGQVSRLSRQVRECILRETGIPPLIAVDQEGGAVERLKGGCLASFPGNRALGIRGDKGFARQVARKMGMEMFNVGINLNFAPVVDVAINPNNSIGARSFGGDPQVVTQLAGQMIEGFHQSGVLTVLKHFPGYGDTETDPHFGLPVVNKSRDQMESVEFYPFRELCHCADAIMTAHIFVPALDLKNCATLSKTILTDILRKQWGYDGVIISDSIVTRVATYSPR